MLLGTLLIGVPIIIHLLNRSRFRIEAWGAMMFLTSAVRVRSQRIRIEQIILMLLRCLFLLLLAVALARPVTNIGSGTWKDATTHVVIIDGSYSMQQGEGSENVFERARESALHIVEGMRERDNMLIAMGGNKWKPLSSAPLFDKIFLTEKIKELKPGSDQIMDFPRILTQAYWALEQSTLPRHRIYILTDEHRHGWLAEETARWEKLAAFRDDLRIKPYLYVLDHKPADSSGNLAVVKLYHRSPVVDIYRPARFMAEIYNYGQQTETVHAEFHVDGKLAGEKDFSCSQGINTISFDHSFGTEEENAPVPQPEKEVSYHYVTVKIEKDALELDNSCALALEVRHTIPVLVIEGNDTEDVLEADGGVIDIALSSASGLEDRGLFKVTRKSLYEITGEDIRSLSKYKTVVLANIPSFSHELQFALERFVEMGGGIFVMLGDRIDSGAYNRMSGRKGLLPAELMEVKAAGVKHFTPSFPSGNAGEILDVFDVSRTRVLNEVKIEKFWTCKPDENAIRLGFLDDEPFLVTKRFGEGRVLLWTTSPNARWSNFPMTQDFLPLVQNLAVYLSSSVQPPVNLDQGETLVCSVSSSDIPDNSGDKRTFTIEEPDGTKHEVEGRPTGDLLTTEWDKAASPGIYRVIPPGGSTNECRYYSVRLAQGEGNLQQLSGREHSTLKKTVVEEFANDPMALDVAVSRETGVKEWWRTLIFIAITVLCVELYLGWRFGL